MKTKTTFKALLAGLLLLGTSSHASAQAFTENFDDINTLVPGGWFMQNNSTPLGTLGWFQGNPTVFNAYNGATSAYIGANFNNTSGAGTISNWLLTPNRTFKNGDVISFYTRKTADPQDYPDRLQVRLSTNGTSTNVGTGGTGVGDFTTVLLEINPTLVVGGYPTSWTQYSITISGLTAPTSGRIAFRYFVTNGGPSGTNSDYIGIDNVVYTPYTCPAFTLSSGGALTQGEAGSTYAHTLTQTGALGTPTFAVTAGALPPGITLGTNGSLSGTPTATGTFNFTVTVSDASGCTGSQSYSITVVCGPNPISFAPISVCSNDGLYTLNSATPAGGTYSGTGVSGNQFDVTAGNQSILYDYTDVYGCAHSQSATITVNTSPAVSLGADVEECGSSYMLTATNDPNYSYAWNPGSSTTFENSVSMSGTYIVTVTDPNSCTDSDTIDVVLNPNPVVTFTMPSDICEYNAAITMNATPAGGTYSGPGVTGSTFTPATAGSGTHTIQYDYTDANNCSASESAVINVSECLGLDENKGGLSVSVYPNPSEGIFTFTASGLSDNLSIEVYNLQGVLIHSDQVQITESIIKTIDLREFAGGVYYLSLNYTGGSQTLKLCKE